MQLQRDKDAGEPGIEIYLWGVVEEYIV